MKPNTYIHKTNRYSEELGKDEEVKFTVFHSFQDLRDYIIFKLEEKKEFNPQLLPADYPEFLLFGYILFYMEDGKEKAEIFRVRLIDVKNKDGEKSEKLRKELSEICDPIDKYIGLNL